ncbi:hypothetical protein CISG_04606 [Coccidioides immitis RMSCC 3703]|uniref:Uncharacterized protein n=1 Tax=Coccidioides immitis RMSCC 3703 TaxID=454286 RepID=A0A0J8TKR6_COCIT|nr:hypothetical protein CISG_04606 [Coccidioides immitis RMSCC 3703]
MAEAAGFSSASLSHYINSRRETDAPRPAPSKLSQKERKKMKQQQMQEASTEAEPSKTESPSPWQIPRRKLQSPFTADREQEDLPSVPRRTSSKAPLTLRQTVAGTPPPPSNDEPESSSSPSLKPGTNQHKPGTNTNTEFQEWWDAESKRVMEEEAAAIAAAAAASASTSRTRGSGRGRSKGRAAGGAGGGGSGGRGRGRDSRTADKNNTERASFNPLRASSWRCWWRACTGKWSDPLWWRWWSWFWPWKRESFTSAAVETGRGKKLIAALAAYEMSLINKKLSVAGQILLY